MRNLVLAIGLAALSLGGCTQEVEKAVSESAATPGEEWSLNTLGDDANRVFLVRSPKGEIAAARLEGGKSSLLSDAEAKSAMEQQGLLEEPLPEKVSISAPGVSIKVAANDTADGNDQGRVSINAGGVSINVDGRDTGGGSGSVRIGGVNDDAARKFIDDINGLSPEVKQQMREKLGL